MQFQKQIEGSAKLSKVWKFVRLGFDSTRMCSRRSDVIIALHAVVRSIRRGFSAVCAKVVNRSFVATSPPKKHPVVRRKVRFS